MSALRIDEIARRMNGVLLGGDTALSAGGFSIDTRLVRPGDVFFAVVGSRNGHAFVGEAAARGAVGAVVSEDIPSPRRDFALIKVENTVRALQNLARSVYLELRPRIVGITGSIGKTTTKEFTAEILSAVYPVLKSEKSFNNHLGFALSLLRLGKEHRVAVLEMGMSAAGEIAALTRIAPPDVAVVTNIHPVHLQFFDGLEGIARAKKEILDGAAPGATAVLNGDDPRVLDIARDWKGGRLLFGRSSACDVRAESIRPRGDDGLSFDLLYNAESAPIELPFQYESFIDDFLAAAAAALALSVPFETVAAKAPALRPYSMRGTLIRLGDDIRVMDDSYNSSPDALDAALKSLAALPAKRRVAVLGDMLELGSHEAAFHAEAGRTAAKEGWDVLIAVGPLARHIAEGAKEAGLKPKKIRTFDKSIEAAEAVLSLIEAGDIVLVKGSRGVHMEVIVELLKERFEEN